MKTTDDQIRNAVLNELKWDPKITSSDIAVLVEDNVVALSGFASSYWEKVAAENAVKRVYGVKGVANDIAVNPTGETDPEIARNAAHALAIHMGVPDDKITVTVNDGWIKLEGAVNWQYQKSLAETTVKNIKGVRGVANNIKIEPTVSSANVKHDIEEALRRSAEVDARRISVQTEGGTVKLFGSVRAWIEKNEAEQAAWSSRGVKSVESHIAISP